MSGESRRAAGPDGPEWQSFWDLCTPLRAAALLFELYGVGAVAAAADCACTSQADGREADVRFWDAVAVLLLREFPEQRH